jgi:hypothetical protein
VSAAALEIHDAGLLLVHELEPTRPLTPPSPGYALIDGSRLLTGIEAAFGSRLHPRRVQHRFWCELETAKLKHPLFRDYSSADLAYAHLSQLWRSAPPDTDSVWIAAPGSMTDRQLGLLVGVARACGIPLAGMVDAAVAACAGRVAPPRVLHLDLELHRTVLTEIEVGEQLQRGAVEIEVGVGLISLQDLWMKRIAETFVRRTRFDPFHSAAAEQALHRRLPQWLAMLKHDQSVHMELTARSRTYAIELSRAEVVAFVDEQYGRLAGLVDRVAAGKQATFVLSERAGALPGLAERLGEDTQILTTGAAAGTLRHRGQLAFADEDPLFVTRLSTGPESRDA